MTQTTGTSDAAPARVLGGADILQFQELVRQVVIAEEVARYAVRLVDASRPGPAPGTPEFVEQVGEVGRRPARVAGAGARRQGARADARPLSRVDQGHPGAGQADPAPPHHDELLRRVRAHHSDAIVERLLEAVPVPKSGM